MALIKYKMNTSQSLIEDLLNSQGTSRMAKLINRLFEVLIGKGKKKKKKKNVRIRSTG